MEFIGYSVVTLAAFFAVFGKGSINPGLAGLAVSLNLTLPLASLSLPLLFHFIVTIIDVLFAQPYGSAEHGR